MAAPSSRTPQYRLHKPSGQAVVTLDGRDIYLGKFGSPASRAEYDPLVGEWLASGRRLPAASDVTVNELLLAYHRHAQGYYVKNGRPTSGARNIALALRPARASHGHALARDFGPLALKAVRRALVESGVRRNEVNKRVRRLIRAFKWAVEEEMIPPSVHQALEAVAGLRQGRSEARESVPVRPVPGAFVEAIRPHVTSRVWAMVRIQLLAGMRPGEVCQMRARDLDITRKVWDYAPASYKTEHHGRERKLFLGPAALEVLRPELTGYLLAKLTASGFTSICTWRIASEGAKGENEVTVA